MKSVLVVSENHTACKAIGESLASKYRIEVTEENKACLQKLQKKRYEFFFIDLDILLGPSMEKNYKAALQPFWQLYPTIPIIVMVPQNRIRQAVMAVKAGACDYVTYPIDPEEIRYVTESTYESIIVQSEIDYLRDQFWHSETLDMIQTRNPLMKKVFDKIRSVAPTKSTVLLSGETGTGKGVLANILHLHSNRKNSQFISVHCGAIPDTLLESELFGHEKGAFTGAVRRKMGKFEIAKSGTVFLDEVGTITPSAQIKLLQILQDGTFQRVGGEETIEADIRVIAATNSDLKQMCDNSQFRKDLYYRLNVFPIEIPPLRERLEDIAHLVEFFLKKLNKFNTKDIHSIHPDVMRAFQKYSWPGNIRELENLIERAYILEVSNVLTPESFPSELFEADTALPAPAVNSQTLEAYRHEAVENAERVYLKQILSQKKGKIKDTAEIAGISTRQLHKLMKRHGLRKEEFKDLH
jgi:DNA-binding NtrC family response regulator